MNVSSVLGSFPKHFSQYADIKLSEPLPEGANKEMQTLQDKMKRQTQQDTDKTLVLSNASDNTTHTILNSDVINSGQSKSDSVSQEEENQSNISERGRNTQEERIMQKKEVSGQGESSGREKGENQVKQQYESKTYAQKAQMPMKEQEKKEKVCLTKGNCCVCVCVGGTVFHHNLTKSSMLHSTEWMSYSLENPRVLELLSEVSS